MLVVVSNTSPITNLAAIGQIDLLRLLYGTIIIPEQVYTELVLKGGPNNPGAVEVRSSTWIEMRKVNNTALVQNLVSPRLAAGEVEAIVLASELNADLLLLDEKQGRRLADQFGLVYTGLLGVLLEAKTAGLISSIRPSLDALRAGPRFRISERWYVDTLRRAGEWP
jgi:predicted nucleic acid-binding protein